MAVLGVIALAVVIFLNRHDLRIFWHLLGSLRWYILAAVVGVQLASYWVNGLYYRSILRIFSYDISVERLFEGALATNFVNYVVPTMGLAGAGYLSQVLTPDVPRGEAVLSQLMRYALSALAVLLMLPVGFLLVLTSGLADRSIVKATLFSTAIIIAIATCIVVLLSKERWARRAVRGSIGLVTRVRPRYHGEKAVWHFVDDFYVGFHKMGQDKMKMLVPFAWSLVYIAIEIGTFYMAFLAFGTTEPLGVVIMAYLFANIASTFGGVFFSTGSFELGMAATLVALGTGFALSVSVTIVYRMLNLLIGLPPGFYFYRKYLPRSSSRGVPPV